EGGQVDLIWPTSLKLPAGAGAYAGLRRASSTRFVRHHRGPDVGLEMIEPAPGTACQAVGSLEAGNPGLDPGAEIAQLAINPAALDHVFDGQAALLVEGDIGNAERLGCREIILAGIAAIGSDLPRRHAAMGDLPLERFLRSSPLLQSEDRKPPQ